MDYTSGSDVYRAHTFISTGSFNVTALSTNPGLPDSVDVLVVAGGGGGGGRHAAGGGAGGCWCCMQKCWCWCQWCW